MHKAGNVMRIILMLGFLAILYALCHSQAHIVNFSYLCRQGITLKRRVGQQSKESYY